LNYACVIFDKIDIDLPTVIGELSRFSLLVVLLKLEWVFAPASELFMPIK
jgi:hypothetical protein